MGRLTMKNDAGRSKLSYEQFVILDRIGSSSLREEQLRERLAEIGVEAVESDFTGLISGMEELGFVRVDHVEGSSEGGRGKEKVYRVAGEGVKALIEARQSYQRPVTRVVSLPSREPMDLGGWDFEALNAERDGEHDTFAYWLGVLKDARVTFALRAEEACRCMSLQYESEPHATSVKGLCSRAEIIPDIFQPVAPVTLTRRWSPFPAAQRLLGRAVQTDRSQWGRGVAFFAPKSELAIEVVRDPHEAHFHFLLRECNSKALKVGGWVLLVGNPGWSYEDDDQMLEDEELRELMLGFGYVYWGRKPREGEG